MKQRAQRKRFGKEQKKKSADRCESKKEHT